MSKFIVVRDVFLDNRTDRRFLHLDGEWHDHPFPFESVELAAFRLLSGSAIHLMRHFWSSEMRTEHIRVGNQFWFLEENPVGGRLIHHVRIERLPDGPGIA